MRSLAGSVPYAWPYDGAVDPRRLALVVAGAQVAWVGRSRRSAQAATVLLGVASALRDLGALVVLVRHGAPSGRRRPSSLPPDVGTDEWRLAVVARTGDLVVDAAGIDGFHGSSLDDVLRARRIGHLVIGGFGHEVAVDSTLRSANDRGYECLVLADGVAPFDELLGERALSSVTMSGGIFGAVGTSAELVHSLHATADLEVAS